MESLSRATHVASLSMSTSGRDSPIVFSPNSESEEWVREWQSAEAKGLIDTPLVAVDAETPVDDACDTLLSKDIPCIAIQDSAGGTSSSSPFLGLLDFADVNAFLTLAALQHTKSAEELRENPRSEQIIKAAKTGKVPVRLVSNLSDKNPLEVLPENATLVDLLKIFAGGTHRVLIRSSSTSLFDASPSDINSQYLGFISDRALLAFFHQHAQISPPLNRFLNNPLHSLTLPSINLRTAVVSCTASARVVDAMKLTSEEGVSSVAVIEDSPTASPGLNHAGLLSAVSVTDIGKIVVPTQNSQILYIPLQQFVSQIKEPEGATDGKEKYPVYSVHASSSLRYAIEKILATNAHRVYVTEDPHSGGSSPATGTSPTTAAPISMSMHNTQLRGVISVCDVLALFARLAGLPDVDSTRMQRHRRLSSASSSSSLSAMASSMASLGSPEVIRPIGVR